MDEIRALYGAGNYKLAIPYKGFFVPSEKWHGWSATRKQEHLKKFREYSPTITDLFSKPANAGRKPGTIQRKRGKAVDIEMVIDRQPGEKQTPEVLIIPDHEENLRFQDPR